MALFETLSESISAPTLTAANVSHAGWAVLTRLGEAQILLPAMLLTAAWMALHPQGRRSALTWVLATGAAAVLTTVSKVAFIGFEVGYAPWVYTGISGHTVFACAVLPVLLACVAGRRGPAYLAAGAGVALALAIALSRLKVRAHSPADVTAGCVLGLAAAAVSLRALWRYGSGSGAGPLWLPAALAAWLLVTPSVAPPSQTHGWVTRLALAVSGRPTPYTRTDMMRKWRLQRAAQAAAAAAATTPPPR